MEPSNHAISQYSSTSERLAVRLAIHNYNNYSQGWFAWAGERLNKTGDVLEVGAGTGELWRNTDRSGARLTLTDFSPAMCEELRKLPNATVRQCDATSLPFENESFDSVIANHMLYHVDDPEAALKEFARVLRPGGQLAVALNGRDHLDELLGIGELVGRPSQIRDKAHIAAETAPGLIGRYFEDIVSERFPGAFEVPTPQPIIDYLSSLDDEPLNAEQREKVLKVVEPRIAADGVFKVNKNMVLFTARRQ
ncbi:methyltransferase type 11 [Patellaria atrata CBS 101060]|uniref:Methyltransferase type 11 n=1 Tax=Patellaria atrata CBS 101060 TaxID=1346257 RepID=A0A9P4SG36_9PEZI|nr:methyltransferase type 11 [Patellaria atrata CBS 101060]